MQDLKVSKIIKDIHALLADPRRWTKGWFAKDVNGNDTNYLAGNACSWCLIGAANKIGEINYVSGWPIVGFLAAHPLIQGDDANVSHFNDNPDTTHEQMLQVLQDRMRDALLLESQGSAFMQDVLKHAIQQWVPPKERYLNY
jgi:hypothetical protein